MRDNRLERFTEKGFEIFLLVICFLIPLTFSVNANDPFWVVEKFFLKFSISILGLLFIALCLIRKEFPAVNTPYTVPFILFIAANLMGFIVSQNMYAAIDRLFVNICYIIIFYLSAWYAFRGSAEIRKMLLTLLGSAFVMGSYGIIQSAGMDFLPWRTTFNGRAASTLGNPNFLAGHMILLIPISYAMFIVSKTTLKKTVFFILSAVLTIAMLASQTRGAYLGYVISLFVMLFCMFLFEKEAFRKNFGIIITLLIAVLVLGGLFFTANKDAVKRIADIITLKDESASIRVSLWKNSMYLIRDNFLLGSGPGNFYIRYPYYQSKSLSPEIFKQNDYFKSGHSHNDFLQFFAEYGIIGAGAMLALFWMIFYTGFMYLKKDGGSKALVIGTLAGMSAIMVHAFFNFPFQILPTTAVFYILAGLAVLSQNQFMVSRRAMNSGSKAVGVILILVFISSAVLSARALTSDFYLRKAKESEHFVKLYEAASYASDAADLNPWNDETVLYYAQILEKTGNHEKSFTYYKLACDLNPGSWEGLLALFNQYAMKNDLKGIATTGDRLYRISPYSEKAVSAYGYALYANSRPNDAIDVYEKAMKNSGETASILSQIAACYGALGNAPKTLEYAGRAVALDPTFTDAYFNMAVVYYRMKDYKTSVVNLKKVLAIYPSDEKANGLLKVITDARKK
jgi:putative inorganic carbon (HCO3(-)) transporter